MSEAGTVIAQMPALTFILTSMSEVGSGLITPQMQQAVYYQQGTVQQAAGPEPGSLDDQVQQIQKLAQMKDMGLITAEEFAAKKQQILGI